MRVLVLHTQPLPDHPNEPATPWAVGPGGQLIGPPTVELPEGRVAVLGFTPTPDTPFLGDGFVPFRQFWNQPDLALGLQALIGSTSGLACCPDTIVEVAETTVVTPEVL